MLEILKVIIMLEILKVIKKFSQSFNSQGSKMT